MTHLLTITAATPRETDVMDVYAALEPLGFTVVEILQEET